MEFNICISVRLGIIYVTHVRLVLNYDWHVTIISRIAGVKGKDQLFGQWQSELPQLLWNPTPFDFNMAKVREILNVLFKCKYKLVLKGVAFYV